MLNRLYYPLSEAIKTLKGRKTDISINDLLHYGVQGKVRFFVHVPSGTRVRQISAPLPTPHDFQPNLLILSPSQCGEIECNKSTRQSEFPSAYADIYSNIEIPPCARNLQYPDKINWQAIDRDGEIDRILLTKQTICIHHSELAQLHQLIDSTNNPPVEFTPQFDEQQQQEINLRCYTFDDALKIAVTKINSVTENDLLRYGYYGKLSFITPRPTNLTIVIKDELGDPTTVTNQPLPDMLALHPEDCYQIEIFGQAKRSHYKNGFICKFKTLIPYSPKIGLDLISENLGPTRSLVLENHRLRVKAQSDENRQWCTYHESRPFPLEIRKDNLYVIRSEFDPLIEAASKSEGITESEIEYTPKFTISDITKYRLSPKKFANLSELAKLAKCSESQILSKAADWVNKFFTPVPCEIALCQALANLSKPKNSHTSVPANIEEIPQLLVIHYKVCEAVVALGHHKQGAFDLGYSFENNELVPCYPNYSKGIMLSNQGGIRESTSNPSSTNDHEKRTSVWLTFYQDKPIEIEITFDRIFIELTESDRSPFLAYVRESLSKHCSDQTSSSPIELGGLDDPIDREIAHFMSLIQNQSLETGNPVSSDAPIERVTVKEFMELSGRSRTTIDNKSKKRDKYPDFPRKIPDEDNVHVHFLRPEVDAWLRKNPPRKRKEK